jgi:dienelactone hydrolase
MSSVGMGQPAMDLRAFRSRRLYRELGINLLLPVLPLHGARLDPGFQRGEGFMSIDLIDSVHGMAQAAWDVRAAIRWIRSQDADAPIGIYGLSLGGFVTALVASLEPGLACAIAGIPPLTSRPRRPCRLLPGRERRNVHRRGTRLLWVSFAGAGGQTPAPA